MDISSYVKVIKLRIYFLNVILDPVAKNIWWCRQTCQVVSTKIFHSKMKKVDSPVNILNSILKLKAKQFKSHICRTKEGRPTCGFSISLCIYHPYPFVYPSVFNSIHQSVSTLKSLSYKANITPSYFPFFFLQILNPPKKCCYGGSSEAFSHI